MKCNRERDEVNINFDAMNEIRKELRQEARERWESAEKARLSKIFADLGYVDPYYSLQKTTLREILDFSETSATLKNIRNDVESGNRRAMLDLLAISADSLSLFETLPQEVRLAIADGLKKIQNNLEEVKGFLPRKRGEKSHKVKLFRENTALITALEVELSRVKFGVNLDEAEARVADKLNMKQDLVHKFWKKAHLEARRIIDMGIGECHLSILERDL